MKELSNDLRTIPVLYLNPHGERAGAETFLDALIRGHSRRPSPRFCPQVVCGTEGEFSRGLRCDGIDVTIRQLRLRHLPSSIWWLRSYLRERGIRLVHTTMAHYHQFAWLASRGLGIKCLWFNHGPCPRSWWKGIAHAFPADAVVVEGRFIAECHRGLTLAPRPQLIHYAVEDRLLESRPALRAARRTEWGVADREHAVGILGRIQDWKRQHCFLDAVAALPPDIVSRCRFFVGGTASIGQGHSYAEELNRRWRSHPYRERIRMLGFIPAEDFWEAIDVAVHCAFEDPFPLVVLEAMAKGKLVIGSNSGGVPEMIAHGKNGFLLDPTDVQGLAGRIADSVTAFETYLPLREAAKETIRTRFSSGRMVAEFERLYGELIGQPEASPAPQELVRN